MRFDDRADAARQLSLRLAAYAAEHPLVLAIPRGGVPLGRIIADALHAELDVVLVRKIGAPFNPEVAVGSVGESGAIHRAGPAAGFGASFATSFDTSFGTSFDASLGAGEDWLRSEAERQLALIRRRRAAYSALRSPVAVEGRTVILVDDGLATGATARAAIHEIRRQSPARLVMAVPVAADDAAAAIAPLVDDFICLQMPADFRSVGQFYRDFDQVDDATVTRLLTPD